MNDTAVTAGARTEGTQPTDDGSKDATFDQKTISALKLCKKDEVAAYLERTIAKETRRMVDILAYAENHTIGSETKSSFNDLKDWKSTKIYD